MNACIRTDNDCGLFAFISSTIRRIVLLHSLTSTTCHKTLPYSHTHTRTPTNKHNYFGATKQSEKSQLNMRARAALNTTLFRVVGPLAKISVLGHCVCSAPARTHKHTPTRKQESNIARIATKLYRCTRCYPHPAESERERESECKSLGERAQIQSPAPARSNICTSRCVLRFRLETCATHTHIHYTSCRCMQMVRD